MVTFLASVWHTNPFPFYMLTVMILDNLLAISLQLGSSISFCRCYSTERCLYNSFTIFFKVIAVSYDCLRVCRIWWCLGLWQGSRRDNGRRSVVRIAAIGNDMSSCDESFFIPCGTCATFPTLSTDVAKLCLTQTPFRVSKVSLRCL